MNRLGGILWIFAANDGGSSSWNSSGHAFLLFRNISSSKIKIGGLNVNIGDDITFGTWGNKSQHTGIWYNLESYFVNEQNAYTNRVSLSVNVTSSDIEKINTYISENDKWSVFSNCSSFAVGVWNMISSTKLSAGSPNTPTSLRGSIMKQSNYELGRRIAYTIPVGYVNSDGAFVQVTMTNSAKSIGDYEISTTNGPAKFVVPINTNPNSMEMDLDSIF